MVLMENLHEVDRSAICIRSYNTTQWMVGMDTPIQEYQRNGKSSRGAKEDSKSAKDNRNLIEIAQETLNVLRSTFGEPPESEFIAMYVWNRTKSPLAALIATIISQNTTEKSSFKAWENLMKMTNGEWRKICDLTETELMEALRVVGLYKQKSKAIKTVCEESDRIEKAIREGNRDELLKVRGIGRKTADVVLALYGHKRFPVDTHVFRVAKRLGLANGNYENMSSKLLELFEENPLRAHMYLILLGRRYCRKRNPLCEKCPLRHLCNWANNSSQASDAKPAE